MTRGLLAGWLVVAACGEAPPATDGPLAVYLVMPDRFALPPGQTRGPLADPAERWGGTVTGLRAQLDHIQDLGVDTLWLTPLTDGQDEPFGGWPAWHGYWLLDPTRPEPSLGSWRDLEGLAADLRRRRMHLVLDVVWNHVGPASPLPDERPTWFHPALPIDDWDDVHQRTQGRVHGLPDLAQEHPAVRAWLLDAAATWVRRLKPTALRVDAVGHMDPTFLRDAAAELRKVLPSLQFYGEDYSGDATRLARTARDTGLTHLFDFPLHYALLDVACHQAPLGRLAGTLSLDRVYGEDPPGLLTFLDNHDTARVRTLCADDEQAVAAAVTLLTALRGLPVVTWGTEAGLEGAREPATRAPMDFAREAPAAGALRRGLALRRSSQALMAGRTAVAELTADRLVLHRLVPEERAVVVIERRPGRRALSVEVTVEAGDFSRDFTAARRPRPVVEVDVQVHAAAPAGARLVLVGAGPELGAWDLTHAVPLQPAGPTWTAVVPAGLGEVLQGKVVAVHEGGAVGWAEGADLTHLVTADGDWQVPAVTWPAPPPAPPTPGTPPSP